MVLCESGCSPLFLFSGCKKMTVDTRNRLLSFIQDVFRAYAEERCACGEPEPYLVDVVMKGSGKRSRIEVFADADAGIAISQCVAINRRLIGELEADPGMKRLAGEDYELLVSSPGIGREIRIPRQYLRHRGRLLRVTYAGEDGSSQELCGRLLEAGVTGEKEPFIVIEPSTGGKRKATGSAVPVTLNLERIIEAVVEVEF